MMHKAGVLKAVYSIESENHLITLAGSLLFSLYLYIMGSSPVLQLSPTGHPGQGCGETLVYPENIECNAGIHPGHHSLTFVKMLFHLPASFWEVGENPELPEIMEMGSVNATFCITVQYKQ